MKKLISMTDFVLERFNYLPELPKEQHMTKAYMSCLNYAQFLKHPLTLGMFVPTDEDGNVLEEPIKQDYEVESDGFSFSYDSETYDYDLEQYQQAKERVLFDIPNLDDLETIKKCIKGETIELLADGTVTLTQSALKQIGLCKD